MAAPTLVASGNGGGNSTTSPKTIAIGDVIVGDWIVVVAFQPIDGATSTYAASDDLGNSYSTIETLDGVTSRRIQVFAAAVTVAGNATVSVTRGVTALQFSCAAIVLRPPPGDTLALDVEGTSTNTTAVNHPCAALGSIDTAEGVAILAFGLADALTGAVGDPTNFTLTQTAHNQRAFVWHRLSDAATTDQRGTWNSANNINSLGYVVSIKTVVGLHQAARRRRRRANSPPLCGSAA